MFKWIKVLSKLTQQDDAMVAFEMKMKNVSTQMDEFKVESVKTLESLKKVKAEADAEVERFKKSVDEFRRIADSVADRIVGEKSELEKLSGEMESYQEAIGKKVEELRRVTQEHLDSVNEKVKAYGSNVSELGKEIVRLGDSIAEFQKR
ncbi:MAG: hypothetical protein Q4G65_11915 [bacterium]|nr:hypothetical protein [bacterium]